MSFLFFLGSPHGCCTNCCLASSHLWWHTLPSYRCSRMQVTLGCPSFSCQCTAATSTMSSFPLFWWTIISGHHLLLQETISGFQFLGEWGLFCPHCRLCTFFIVSVLWSTRLTKTLPTLVIVCWASLLPFCHSGSQMVFFHQNIPDIV